MNQIVSKIIKVVSLFFSFSTLVCCALPAFLGLMGFGAAFAGLVAIFPFLITLSKIKIWLFIAGFILLGINAYYVFFKIQQECPISISPSHQEHNSGCDIATNLNKTMFFISAAILLIGFFMAYLALPLFKFLGIM
ncbi:hypothetical protein IPF37_04115 [bacterium]|nr:MAG: hypothetical protein IPF37_04115 [bacterium]